jgi:arabinogalactan endo-1,4-beta-galactosidase
MRSRPRPGVAAAAALAAALAVGSLATATATVAGAAPDDTGAPVAAGITVPRVDGMRDGWINGVDVSTVLSLEESGVTFKDDEGREADLFAVLADHGVNWVRVRVWNEPFLSTDATKGYGAGNVDAARATEIGRRATAAGMRVLVNFHYADFWAHPGQQPSPRAWRGLALPDREQALYDYTAQTLRTMRDAGVDVGMVQVGNETTNGQVAGESGWDRTAGLFQAGSRAVRDTLGPDVKVAVHFTNPDRAGQYAAVARELDRRGVDYDVFLSSYYAFWHGSLANLTAVLDQVATTYDKEVAVAETSWAYTLEDGDGYPNSVRTAPTQYAASVQGQALAVRDVMQAVADVSGGRGLGTFYWEPAWLPVGPPDRVEASWDLWQQHGSGWATTYAQEFYDPDGRLPEGEWADDFGGSGWDNQALFAFDGTPLESLRVYEFARTGSVGPRDLDAVQRPAVTVGPGEDVTLPARLDVSYTDGTTESQEVTWRGDVTWIGGPGAYVFTGVTAGGHPAAVDVTVLADASSGANLVRDPGFEDGGAAWTGTGTGYTIGAWDDPFEGERSTHFWSDAPYAFTIQQTLTDVPPGQYRLSAKVQGGNAGATDTMRIEAQSGISTVTADFHLDGYLAWQTPQTAPISVGADRQVTVSAQLTLSGGAWGTIDDVRLVADEPAVSADIAPLAALVAEADGVRRDAFTAGSLAVLDAALARAAFVLGSPTPHQATVDGAVAALRGALDGLVPVTTPAPTSAPSPTAAPTVVPAPTAGPTPGPDTAASPRVTLSAATARAGERLTVTLADVPGAQAEVGIASTYRRLALADLVDGGATLEVTVPTDLPAGVHHVQVRDARGEVLAQAPLTVTVAGALAVTGAGALLPLGAGLVLLAAGAAFVAVRRRASV